MDSEKQNQDEFENTFIKILEEYLTMERSIEP